MTIETYTSGGNTYLLVHPAGLSYYDQPTETVNKFLVSESISIGDLVAVFTNTTSGEMWFKTNASANFFTNFRRGVAISASASGAPTVSIKRIPVKVVTASAGAEYDFTSTPGINTNGGDSTNSGSNVTFNNVAKAAPTELSTLVTIEKPSSENWPIRGLAYGYILSGATLYTNSVALASSHSVYWSMGEFSANFAPGVTLAQVLQCCFYDAAMIQTVPLAKRSSSKSITGTLSGTEVQLNGDIFSSPDGLTISAKNTANCNIYLGTCVGVDATLPAHVYNYYDTYGFYEGGSGEAVQASMGGADSFFLSVYAPRNYNSVVAQIKGYRIIARTSNGPGTFTILCAPVLISSGNPALADVAYDPILPAPFNNIRILWTYCPYDANYKTDGLYPVIVNKTIRDSAPYTGMVESFRDRPEKNTGVAVALGDLSNGGGITSVLYPLIRESRSNPYVWNNYWYYMGGAIADIVCYARGCMFPSGKFVFPGYLSSDFKWKWQKFDFASNSWVDITSFVVGSGASAGDVDIAPPSGLAAEEVFFASLRLEFVSGGKPGSGGLFFCHDFASMGVWPYDVVKAFDDTDSGGAWAGNAGWIWPNEPAGAVVTWLNEPVLSLVGNTLSFAATTPTASVAATDKFLGGSPSAAVGAPSYSIVYDDGDSARLTLGSTNINEAYSKGGTVPAAMLGLPANNLPAWGQPFSINVYPSRNGSKRFTFALYYSQVVSSAYAPDSLGYAVPRVITQTFTLP